MAAAADAELINLAKGQPIGTALPFELAAKGAQWTYVNPWEQSKDNPVRQLPQ